MSTKLLPPIHLAASSDENREALQYIEVIDGIATASNGSIICRLNLAHFSNLAPDEIRRLSNKLIHRDVWATIYNADRIEVDGDVISYVKGRLEAAVNIETTVEYVDYAPIIEKITNSEFEKKSFMAFNPEYIVIAKSIFKKETLICRFYKNEHMMVFFPSGDSKGFLGIMPFAIQENEAIPDFTLS